MAKVYRICDDNIEKSEKTTFSTKIEKSIEPVEKTMTILSGSGDWKQFHGIRLFVDSSGTIIKGPDLLISRKWDDLERLTFNDSLTVMNSIMRAVGTTNKSFEDELDIAERQKWLEKAKKDLDCAIKRNKENKKKYDNYKK